MGGTIGCWLLTPGLCKRFPRSHPWVHHDPCTGVDPETQVRWQGQPSNHAGVVSSPVLWGGLLRPGL